jgi:hypothetical protein
MSEVPIASDICPRCEDGILTTRRVPQDINISSSLIRVPDVRVEECMSCGFRSISGRDVGLFELLFAPQYERMEDLVSALMTAGYSGMFLKKDRSEANLGFGSRDYVSSLPDDLCAFYLDNESHHIIQGLNSAGPGSATVAVSGRRYTLELPRLGEGENGVVFEYREANGAVFKIAKPRPYSRNHLKEEYELTALFSDNGIPVPRVLECDGYGSFMIKERLAGESLAIAYSRLGNPESPLHGLVRSAVEKFVGRLLAFFEKYPEARTSISPNNIFVVISGDSCQCLLVDTGPAPFHDYSGFDFSDYWNRSIPEKIKRYKSVGYI